MSNLQIVKLINPIQMTISGTFNPMGAYNASTDYAVGDQVDYNGSSYIMYNDAAAGTVPTNTTYWGLIASKGDTGATGTQGLQGNPTTVNGKSGASITLNIDDVAPTQTGNSGKVLKTDGTNATWQTDSNNGTWGSITGTLSDQTDLNSALGSKVDKNTAITGATKTKVTYDSKGLVTAGADATTADIADSTNKRYITDAQQTVLSNTSGTNTGDQDLSGLQPKDATLTSLAAYNTNGLLTQTAVDTFAGRTITGTANQVNVTNGNGVSGNPTLALPQNIHSGAMPTFARLHLVTNTTTLANITADTTANTTEEAQLNFNSGATYTRLFYRDSDKNFGIYTNGTTRFRINNSGNLELNANTFPYSNNTYTLGTSSLYWSNTYTNKLYLNSTAYLDGGTAGAITATGSLGFGSAPTHTLTLNSSSTGIALYNTADQITNYERLRIYATGGNSYDFIAEKNGTGSYRSIKFVVSGAAGILYANSSSANGFIRAYGEAQQSGSILNADGYLYGSSGVAYGLRVLPDTRQSSTAGYTALLINPTETTTGSGPKLLIDAQVGGTSKFKVDNAGSTTIADAANISVGTTTGTKIGTSTSQKLGFWNATPIVQPTTSVAAATFTANSGTAVNDASTFDGYTIKQVVKALRNIGILA